MMEGFRKMRILVVDDEVHYREVVSRYLRKLGYVVDTAGSPGEALRLVKTQAYDFLVTDLVMEGDMDGVELIKAVRIIDEGVIPILMTAYGTIESAVEAMKHGAVGYILKPFTLDTLRLLIERELERKKMEEENVTLRRFMGLYQMSQALVSLRDIQRIVEVGENAVLEEFSADEAFTVLAEGSNFEGIGSRSDDFLQQDLLKAVASLCVEEDEVVLLVDGRLDDRLQVREMFYQSVLGVPLRVRDRTIGCIVVARMPGRRNFTQGEARGLTVIANSLSLAIDNAMVVFALNRALESMREHQEHLLRAEREVLIREVARVLGEEVINLVSDSADRQKLEMFFERFERQNEIEDEHSAVGLIDNVLSLIEFFLVRNKIKVEKKVSSDFAIRGERTFLELAFLHLIVSIVEHREDEELRILLRRKRNGGEIVLDLASPCSLSYEKGPVQALRCRIVHKIIEECGGKINVGGSKRKEILKIVFNKARRKR